MPIGTQVYPVRKAIGSDFEGTLRNLAKMGYRSIEMCSPVGYKGDFAALAELKASELRQRIRATGLNCESSHYSFRELKDNLPETIEYAKGLGLTQMILASFGLRQGATLDDWARAADELNRVGEQALNAGMQKVSGTFPITAPAGLVGRRQANGADRQGSRRLAKAVCGGQKGRGKELLRRGRPGVYAGQHRIPEGLERVMK
jgi:hypothetical protein